jgi:Ni/Co efflux regulator RcnB
MTASHLFARSLCTLLAVATLTASVAMPAVAKPDKKHHKAHGDEDGARFTVEDRDVVRRHYHEAGCPPGLAKKHNGCLPPGQAKKAWAIGAPLPRDVVYEPVAPELVVHMHPPPAGYEYVRVAGDILMLAAGTRMVADAITDLGR